MVAGSEVAKASTVTDADGNFAFASNLVYLHGFRIAFRCTCFRKGGSAIRGPVRECECDAGRCAGTDAPQARARFVMSEIEVTTAATVIVLWAMNYGHARWARQAMRT